MRRPLLVALPLLLGSCMLPSGGGTEPPVGTDAPAAVAAPAAEPAEAPVTDLGKLEEPAAAPGDPEEPETSELTRVAVPTGVFPSIEALCAAQRELVKPMLAAAEKELGERYEGGTKLTPRCERVSLAKVDVKLKAPVLEVAAIDVEAGWSSATHVVVRTAAGFRAVPHASVVSYHEDPGCFSIERDSGLSAIRVEGESLVIVEGAARGARMEEMVENADGTGTQITWDDSTTRAVACRLTGASPACDAPVVVRVERVPSTTEGGRTAALLFSTSYAVDAQGHVEPETRFQEAHAEEP